MSKEGATSTLKESKLKMWDNNGWASKRARAKMWNGSSWIDVPLKMWNGNSWTVINEGVYQTTWYADWSETYAYLNKAENHSEHGVKRHRPPVTLQRQKGSHFIYQGWWSSDPHGKMGGLMGFRTDLIRRELAGATIEKVELYIRNVHSYYSSGQTAHIYWHNYTSKPNRIKKSAAFTSSQKLGSWAFHRGASVQRTNSPAASKVDWNTGYGTGLVKFNSPNINIEGNNNMKKVWIVMPNSLGERFKNGQAAGFGLYHNSANSQGDYYGYWNGSELTVPQYRNMESVNRTNGFNDYVSWKPQLRITYRKING